MFKFCFFSFTVLQISRLFPYCAHNTRRNDKRSIIKDNRVLCITQKTIEWSGKWTKLRRRPWQMKPYFISIINSSLPTKFLYVHGWYSMRMDIYYSGYQWTPNMHKNVTCSLLDRQTSKHVGSRWIPLWPDTCCCPLCRWVSYMTTAVYHRHFYDDRQTDRSLDWQQSNTNLLRQTLY